MHHKSVLKAGDDKGHSRLQSLSQEQQLAMIRRQNTIMRIPEPGGGETEAALWTPETEKGQH